jgi:hypothetical protein
MKNIEEFVEWMALNPELAKKNYPELTMGLQNTILKAEPFVTALIIQKLPSHFAKWKSEAEQGLTSTRTKKIKGYIKLLNLVLNELEYANEIEKQAIETVRVELTEQVDYWKEAILKLEPEQIPTKSEVLKAELSRYGFFELPKVKSLSELNKGKLVELINSNKLPYCIAMFDFLEYIKHLEKEHFKIKDTMYKAISKWLYSSPDGRAVKGNICSLLKNSIENKKRYTADKQKEKVQKDYRMLKSGVLLS